MSRFIRLYEKKRGDRRTGSKAFGNFGEALFFAMFLAVGCLAFAYMWTTLVWPEWRANRQFAETLCTVRDKTLGERPPTTNDPAAYRPEFRITYRAGERQYDAQQVYDVTGMYTPDRDAVEAVLAQYEIGREYPAWYDPIDPHRVVLVRGYSGWLYLLLLIPLSFIIIGGGRLVYALLHWNASAERRALMTQRAASLDLFEVDSDSKSYPNVPADANLTNSPGTNLAYRLPIATSTGWVLFAVAAACLLWNGIVTIFVVMAARDFAAGAPDWTLVACILPFAAGGVALFVYLLRQIMRTTGVGPTRVEISDHPLAPGEPYDIFLSQAGRLHMNRLEMWLACDEKATYRQGTDTRIETRRVYEERFFVREKFDIHQGLPFESRCLVRVPQTAMHSFQAQHNAVSWKLIVKGSVVGWPDYQRTFQIIVNPAANGRSHS